MLSGNGRHRRPRQAPALLVAAGVTGSAIAIPLLGASGASAADGTVWDKVADCASGGSWSADTGNGRFGGLQLTQADWEKYGGLDYATSPELASRSQQITVAQAVLADQGVGAWRTCGVLSGLTQKSGALDLDTGVTEDSPSAVSGSSGLLDSVGSSGSSGSDASRPSGASSPSGTSASPSDGPSVSPSGSPESSGKSEGATSSPSSPSKSDNSGKPGKSSGAGTSASPDSSPVESPEGDVKDNWVQDAGSWSLVDTSAVESGPAASGRHRGPSADEKPAANDPKSAGRHASYLVRPGDTLASIADSLDVDGGWRALYEANKRGIGGNANDIAPGQTLDVPVE
ncbi:hypothetical protein SZN_13275 [Streptomyces zinciresistens K42]|uniref:LysM domain-containing protein n=1 Tax=Streptomyces zinciresistens K42 TaxID=700597 RepID=G2GAY2_9ACTN|nr:transglycosylase family protein [Streptomyces zinciresistens]EGX59373.1 hypothetical protein SZN_13275 [Streptomyces zinciresistens K42]